jgi:ectoine hydroxylase-related dioxygenase (phytanoyl-CoA dioxygenase family)
VPSDNALNSVYETYGFVAIHDLFTSTEVEELRAAFDCVMESAAGGDKQSASLKQAINLWAQDSCIKRYVLDQRLGTIAKTLIGSPRVRLWHDQGLVKPAGGAESPWHQDLPFWPVANTDLTSCWLAIDDVDEQNGCLQFIPGSHLYGAIPLHQQCVAKSVLESRCKDVPCAAVSVQLRAGSCSFHHGFVLHYAPANHTERPRRALKIIYMRDGTRYAPKHHSVTASLNLAPGEVLDDPNWFPLVS